MSRLDPILAFLGIAAAASLCATALRPPQDQGSRQSLAPQRVQPEVEPGDVEGERVTPVVLAVRKAAPSVVSIHTMHASAVPWLQRPHPGGHGSGVIVDEDGLVITNWHVVWNPTVGSGDLDVRVLLNDGTAFDADLISASPRDDLALLRIRDRGGRALTPVAMGSSGSLMIGETVIAIGNPRGQANTVTVGVLSATERDIQVPWVDGRSVHRFEGLLQTDAAINPGNSGGALLDITGKLIGINNAIRTDSEGINFAIPVDRVREVFNNELLSYDGASRLWMGLRLDPDASDHVVVGRVEVGGPAWQAGLRPGDRIEEVEGRSVRTRLDFAKQALEKQPGENLRLRVRRGGSEREARVPILSPEQAALIRHAGFVVEPVAAAQDQELLRAATAAFWGARGPQWALRTVWRVEQVYPEGPAALLGLREGDVLFARLGRDRWGRLLRARLPDNLAGMVELLRRQAGRSLGVVLLREGEVLEGDLEVR